MNLERIRLLKGMRDDYDRFVGALATQIDEEHEQPENPAAFRDRYERLAAALERCGLERVHDRGYADWFNTPEALVADLGAGRFPLLKLYFALHRSSDISLSVPLTIRAVWSHASKNAAAEPGPQDMPDVTNGVLFGEYVRLAELEPNPPGRRFLLPGEDPRAPETRLTELERSFAEYQKARER